MVIEISLTRKLCDKLELTLLPLENDCPKENHFYADIISEPTRQLNNRASGLYIGE